MNKTATLFRTVISIHQQQHTYKKQRKIGQWRKLMLFSSLLCCRYLTLEQIMLLLHLDHPSARKFVSLHCKSEELSRESFEYCDRFPTYSLSSNGLSWVISQISSIPEIDYTSFSSDFLTKTYRDLKKTKENNHTVCIYQFLISMIVSSDFIHACPEFTYSLEYMLPMAGKINTEKSIKTKDSLVADLYCTTSTTSIYIEADTLEVHYRSKNGPEEKLSKYALHHISELENSTIPFQKSYLMFSIQKKKEPFQVPVSTFSETELSILNNPERINNSVTLIRLVKELAMYEHHTVQTIEDTFRYLLSAASTFSSSLVHAALIRNTSTILHCLMQNGYGQSSVDLLRPALQELGQIIQENSRSHMLDLHQSSILKRKKEMYQTITSSSYQTYACLHGQSILGFNGYQIHKVLPALIPELFMRDSLYNTFTNNLGIGTSCMYNSPKNSSRPFLLNELELSLHNNSKAYLYIENISDDIGGFLRAKEYMKTGYAKDTNYLLILLVDDTLHLADGSHISEGTLYPCDSPESDIAGYFQAIDLSEKNTLSYFAYTNQDFAFSTYTEFLKSFQEAVIPKLYLPGLRAPVSRFLLHE